MGMEVGPSLHLSHEGLQLSVGRLVREKAVEVAAAGGSTGSVRRTGRGSEQWVSPLHCACP